MNKTNSLISYLIALLFALLLTNCKSHHISYQNPLHSLLQTQAPQLDSILKNPKKYQVQIIYTKIDRNDKQTPRFTTYHWNVDNNRYFYPASTVKFPAALLALEKLNKLNISGLDKYTPVRFDSVRTPQQSLYIDTTAKDSIPTLAHLIKQIFIVSDNEAYNRVFEFLGQDYIQKTLRKKGYLNTKIAHRLEVGGLTKEDNLYTSPVTFYRGQDTIYHQPAAKSNAFPASRFTNLKLGKAYQKNGEIISQPMDFTDYNGIALQDLHDFIKAVIFPEAVPARQRFDLKAQDYQFLYQVMSQFPRESQYPTYTKEWDSYGKFLFWGNSKEKMPTQVRIFNKIGQAYGFLTDAAYFVDFANGVEFILSATIFVNNNQTFNDNKYEYKTIGFPFLHHLGQLIYNYEKQRPKKVKPDLSQFRINYD
ncbi:hypothetical protein BKI52_00900 [marine bacterium AO1-C]|nr:hypothetical protein BKI52_00900 [marine bacterium AO1-C]